MNPRRDKKSLIVGTACVLITVAAGLWIYYISLAGPEFNEPLQRAVGQVLAEETSRLLNHRGAVVIITVAPAHAPELKVQIEEFQAALKRLGKVKIDRTYELETEGKAKYGVGAGLSGRRFVRIVKKNLHADALVSLVGAPSLSEEELREISKRPKFIAESRSTEKLGKLFQNQAIDLAITSRYSFPAPIKGKPRSAREWFDKYFQIVTPAMVPSLPAVKSE